MAKWTPKTLGKQETCLISSYRQLMQLCIIIHNLAVLSFQMMTASKYTGCTEGIVKQVSWPNLRIHELPLRWLDPDKFIRLFICFSHQALMWRKLAQRPVVEVLLPAALAKRQLERCLSQRMLRWRKTSQEGRRRTQRNNPKRKIQKLKKRNLCRKTSKRFLFNISIPCSDFFDQLHVWQDFQSVGNYFDFFLNLGCVTSLKKLANWPVTWTLWASLIKRRLLSSDDDMFFPV